MTTAISPAVVLLSGGMDSSVLVHHVARAMGACPVYALSYHYGQRHSRELECAQWQARQAGVAAHQVIDIRFMGEMLKGGTTLVHDGADVPDLAALAPEDMAQPPTYVPNRNMMLLSIAAAFAEAHQVYDVYYGAQAQDEYGYWDCTRDFLQRVNAVLALNRRRPVTIHAPFVDRKKADIVRHGLELGVDFAHTWSCYRGAERPCGTCPTCVERLKAFAEAGVADPLECGPPNPTVQ